MNDTTINWVEVRNNAAISFMSAIIETTQHPVLETEAVKDVYAIAAVQYADALIQQLIKHQGNKIRSYGEPVV